MAASTVGNIRLYPAVLPKAHLKKIAINQLNRLSSSFKFALSLRLPIGSMLGCRKAEAHPQFG